MRKLIAIVMCLVIGISMVACGSNKDNNKPTETTPPTNTTTPSEVADSSDATTEVVWTDEQIMWKNIFDEGLFTVESNELNVVIADTLSLNYYNGENERLVSVSDAKNTIAVTLLERNNNLYCKYEGVGADGVSKADWYVCENVNGKNNETDEQVTIALNDLYTHVLGSIQAKTNSACASCNKKEGE